MRQAMWAAAAVVVTFGILAIVSSFEEREVPEESETFDRAWAPGQEPGRAVDDSGHQPADTDSTNAQPDRAPSSGKVAPSPVQSPPASPPATPPPPMANTAPGMQDGVQTGAVASARSSDDNNDAPTGSLSKEAIKEVVTQMKPNVKRCYNSLLETFPEAEGRVNLSFEIVAHEGKSHVDMEQATEYSTLQDAELYECMVGELRGLEFPLPEGGDGRVKVNYPFVFEKGE